MHNYENGALTVTISPNDHDQGHQTIAAMLIQTVEPSKLLWARMNLVEKASDKMSNISATALVVILFVCMAKGMFLCCGRCHTTAPQSQESEIKTSRGVNKVGDSGLVQLQLELLDWGKLEQSQHFYEMVHGWLRNENGSATTRASRLGKT